MNGRDFVAELERHGFIVRRRSSTFVWVARGDQTLMLDVEATVPDTYLARILAPRPRPPAERPSVDATVGSTERASLDRSVAAPLRSQRARAVPPPPLFGNGCSRRSLPARNMR